MVSCRSSRLLTSCEQFFLAHQQLQAAARGCASHSHWHPTCGARCEQPLAAAEKECQQWTVSFCSNAIPRHIGQVAEASGRVNSGVLTNRRGDIAAACMACYRAVSRHSRTLCHRGAGIVASAKAAIAAERAGRGGMRWSRGTPCGQLRSPPPWAVACSYGGAVAIQVRSVPWTRRAHR
jgi:hypothetical protein